MKVYRYLTGKDDDAFCHRVTEALSKGFELYGPPTLTYDLKRETVICGQALTKEIANAEYDPKMDLRSL